MPVTLSHQCSDEALVPALSELAKALYSLQGHFHSTHPAQEQVLPKACELVMPQASNQPLSKTPPLNLSWSHRLTG